jgi:pimeloyl-ACP methyl ester carboxylesterase
MRIAVWARRTAVALLVVWAAFILGWAPYFLAGLVTTRRFQFADKENQGLTPKSFDLAFEEASFSSSDGIALKGWWVPAADAKGSVVLVHGLNRSRIEMVKKTAFLARSGWNSLLFDLRHHGESGGDATTFGAKEKNDVKAAIAFARAKSPGPVVLWGVSLGGATATLAIADDPTVAGLVCDSSYRSLRDTVSHHLVLFRGFRWWTRLAPSWPVADEAVYWIGRRGGFDPDQVDIVAAARKLNGRPALFVCNSEDRRMPKDIAIELQAAAGPQAKLLVVPGQSHGGAYRDATAQYEHAVQGLLNEVAGGGSAERLASR